MADNNVVMMRGEGIGEATSGSRSAPSPKIPMSASDVAKMKPEDVPSFTTVAALVDRTMSRLPWWVVAAGAAGGTWWLLRKR